MSTLQRKTACQIIMLWTSFEVSVLWGRGDLYHICFFFLVISLFINLFLSLIIYFNFYQFFCYCNFFTLLTTGRPWPTPGFVHTPSSGQLKNNYSLRSFARTAAKNRAIATSHCLPKNGLVELVWNTLNDGNLQKISLVVSLLARSFRSQLNRCAPSDPRQNHNKDIPLWSLPRFLTSLLY